MSKPVKHKAVFMKKKILFTCLSVLGLNQLIFGGNGNTQGTAFRANRISRTARITLNAPLKTVFPLFGPIEEKKWAHGWDPRIIFPDTNRLEQKMIFKTGQKDKDETDYIWVVSSLIPQDALIEYTTNHQSKNHLHLHRPDRRRQHPHRKTSGPYLCS